MKATLRVYRDLISFLPRQARAFLIRHALVLSALSILDGIALGLLAVVIAPLATGSAVVLPVVGTVDQVGLIVVIAVICALIVLKGLLAIAAAWRATRVFARYELELGARLFGAYTRLPWVERLRRNSADIVRLTDSSVSTTISGFLLPGSLILSELVSFVTVVTVLAIAAPTVALITLVYLGGLGFLLFLWLARRARQAGLVALRYSLRSSRLITEMVAAIKEITLRGKLEDVAEVVRSNRVHSTRARSNSQFLGQVPRYALESGIVGGFVIAGFAGYLSGGVVGATTAVALFGVAGFRIAPSVVRLQAILAQMNVSQPHAEAVLAEIRASESLSAESDARPFRAVPDGAAAIELRDVDFRYSPDSADVLRGVSLTIPFGSTVAFVGPSGAGKSTIVDLLLGLIEPSSGAVAVDGVPLHEITTDWRTRVAYVPQEVAIFDSTIARNVALTWSDDFDRDRVERALDRAQLLATVRERDDGLDARVGERGLALSGGQRQRLGIARALYAEPLVLVMDEATSALDTATEAAVADAIHELRGTMTLVMVAHRLSTVKSADVIFYLRDGELVASGTFDHLIATVPDFAEQARLAGLAGDETG